MLEGFQGSHMMPRGVAFSLQKFHAGLPSAEGKFFCLKNVTFKLVIAILVNCCISTHAILMRIICTIFEKKYCQFTKITMTIVETFVSGDSHRAFFSFCCYKKKILKSCQLFCPASMPEHTCTNFHFLFSSNVGVFLALYIYGAYFFFMLRLCIF